MSADLIERLRIKAGVIEMGEKIAWGSDSSLMYEAADALAAKDTALSEMRVELERVRVQFENTAQVRDTLYRDLDRVKTELERVKKALEAGRRLANVAYNVHQRVSAEGIESLKSAQEEFDAAISARAASQDEGEER